METLEINDINLFNNYINIDQKSIQENLHLTYFIASPKELYTDNSLNKRNDTLFIVVILIHHTDGRTSFKEIKFSWNSIDLMQTFATINVNGQLSYLQNHDTYQTLFSKETLQVDLQSVQELTLYDVVKDYGYYRKLDPLLLTKYQDEKFLLFTDTDKVNQYIIPAIEVTRYFYCFSKSDSLKQAVFHPSGIRSLVKNATWIKGTTRYNLQLESLCKVIDSKKIFYFIHNPKYLHMFHSIYYNYKKDRLVRASFPFEQNFHMTCKMLKLSSASKNTFLITKILDSSMLNQFFTKYNIDLHVYHPQSQEDEDHTGKRDLTQDTYYYEPDNEAKNFNDQLGALASLPPQIIEDEPDLNYFPEEKKTFTVEKQGKRIERGGRVKHIPIKPTDSSTHINPNGKKQVVQKLITSDKKSSKPADYPTPMEATTTYDLKEISAVIKEFTDNDFFIQPYRIFEFPDKTNGKKRAISYLDRAMTEKRKYIILSIFKNDQEYLYVDVEAKKNKKEVLVLRNQSEAMAHQCIYQQVYFGNHKWLSKNNLDLKEYIDFIRAKHSPTIKQLVENIISKL